MQINDIPQWTKPYKPNSHCCQALTDKVIDIFEQADNEEGGIKLDVAFSTLRRWAKPKQRGGEQLYYRNHRILPREQWKGCWIILMGMGFT